MPDGGVLSLLFMYPVLVNKGVLTNFVFVDGHCFNDWSLPLAEASGTEDVPSQDRAFIH